MKTTKHNLWQLIISIDQLLAVLLGLLTCSRSWADETLSSKAFRKGKRSKFYSLMEKVINLVFFFDTKGSKKHCELSYESERNNRHLPPEMRG